MGLRGRTCCAIVILALLSPMLATADTAEESACVHPYPCDEMPEPLDGPFDLKEVLYVTVESHDGTPLEGWIGLPDVPAGTRVPVALHSTPYLGFCPVVPYLQLACTATPDEPTWWTSPAHINAFYAWGVDPLAIVRRGIAAAFFSVRGTGNSGGCLDEFGNDEQRDQVALVEWLAEQEWSNGRVAMGGVSYPGTTPWEAAIHAPEGLKTIITAGIISDLYTFNFTPQGAAGSYVFPFWWMWAASTSFAGPLGGTPEDTLAAMQRAPERACEDVLHDGSGYATDVVASERRADFYAERRLIDRFDDVTAAVLLAQGFRDNTGHVHQESLVWDALTQAPKRMIEGAWGHSFPQPELATLDPVWQHDTWEELLLAWLDYWLRGAGFAPEHLGLVDYQDSTGRWRQTSAWPPPEARTEALYLTGETLAPDPAEGDRSFQSIPMVLNEYAGAESVGFPFNLWPSLCLDAEASAAGIGVAYQTPPLAEQVTIAGNIFASLRVSSDQPSGIVGAHLLEIPSDFECSAGADASKIHVVGWGAADLQYHASEDLRAVPFPVDTPTELRIELWDNAETIEAGNRLAVVVSYGEMVPVGLGTAGQPSYPRITVHAGIDAAASHVVLPIVEGSLGGDDTGLDYPPRPFTPGS